VQPLGFHASLEFKAGLKMAIDVKTPKLTLNCFWK